jgi:hypothetical protein
MNVYKYACNECLGCNIRYHQRLLLFTALCLHEPNLKLHDQQHHPNLNVTPFRLICFKSVRAYTQLTFSCTRVHSLKITKPHMGESYAKRPPTEMSQKLLVWISTATAHIT